MMNITNTLVANNDSTQLTQSMTKIDILRTDKIFAKSADLVKSLGADVVVDYRQEDFEKVLSGYDVVLNSLGKDTLEKSLKVLKPGGKLISISSPPDAAFAKEIGSNWFLQQVMRLPPECRSFGELRAFLGQSDAKGPGARLERWCAGNSLGWGLQFQNPYFLIFLTLVLVVFMGNLLGIFEINFDQVR